MSIILMSYLVASKGELQSTKLDFTVQENESERQRNVINIQSNICGHFKHNLIKGMIYFVKIKITGG